MLSVAFVNALAIAPQSVVAEGGGEAGGESFWEKATPILPHPAELIIGTIAFAVLYFVFAKLVVPQFEAAYEKRAQAIEGGIARAERAQAEADAAKAAYTQQLAEAREEATQMREGARTEAAAIAADIRKKANEDAERITSSAARQVEAERSAAMVSLRRDVGGLATVLAGKIVGEQMTDQGVQQRVIDRFLADLEKADPDQVREAAYAGESASSKYSGSALDRLTGGSQPGVEGA